MEKLLFRWKKVYLQDLEYVVGEMQEVIKTPSMVLLDGEMGVGKTSLLKSFFPRLELSSPSYSIISEIGQLAYGDLYRIEQEEELVRLEIPLYLDRKDYFFVEWGMKFYDFLLRQVDPGWAIYRVQMIVNDSTKGDSRDYALYQMFD